MTLQELQSILQGQIAASGAITIDDATLQTTGVDALILASPLQASSIVVTTTETIPPPTTTLTVNGTTAMLGQAALATTVVFQEGANGIGFTLTATLPATWTFGKSFPQVVGSQFDLLSLSGSAFVFTTVLSTPTPGGLSLGLNYSGTLSNFAALYASALSFLGVTAPSALALQGPLGMDSAAAQPTIDVRAIFGATVPIGPITLSDGYIGALLNYPPDDSTAGDEEETQLDEGALAPRNKIHLVPELAPPPGPAQAALTVGGTVTVAGTALNLSAILADPSLLQLSLTTDLSLAAIADLVALLGPAGSWQSLLPSQLSGLGGFTLQNVTAVVDVSAIGTPSFVTYINVTMGITNPWTIVKDTITVQSIQVTWSVTTPLATPFWGIDVQATTLLGTNHDIEFDLDISVPGLNVTGALVVNQTFDLPTLIADMWGGGLQVPPDLVTLTLDSLLFSAAPAAGVYTILAQGTASLNIFDLQLQNFSLTFTKNTSAGLTAALTATVELAGLTFPIEAQLQNGFVFRGSLARTTSISATSFLSELTGSSITVPSEVPDFQLTQLSIELNSATNGVSLAAAIAAQWPIAVANAKPSIDVAFSVTSSVQNGKRSYTGFVTGQVSIGQMFDLTYTFGDRVSVVQGTWSGGGGGLSYKNVAASLGINVGGVSDPLGMSMPDFGLTSASLTIDFNQPSVTFGATSSSFGSGYFAATKATDGSWGFFLGVAAASGWKFSSLPGDLGKALAPLDFATFESAYLVIATKQLTLTSAQLPPLGKATMTVVPGLNAGMLADLTSGSGQLGNTLNDVSGIDQLFIQGAIGPSASTVFLLASLTGPPITIPNAGGIQLSQPFVKMFLKPPALTLGGSALIPWSYGTDQTQSVTVTGFFTINVDSVIFSVNVEFASLGAPLGFVGVSLTEIGASIGLDFEPPSVELGLEAMFVLGKTMSKDEFAFVFDVAPEVINPKLLMVRISEMDLQTIFALVVPKVTLPSALGSGIRFSDFFIYWCDQPTTLPDGTQAQPGFGFNGEIDVFGVLDATAALMINSAQGIAGGFSLAPITVTAGGVQVLSVTGAGGGNLSFSFSTISSPYLAWSGAVSLLGIAQASTTGLITSGGFAFSVQLTLLGSASAQIACMYKSSTDFSGAAEFSIAGLDLTLGPWEPGGVTVVPQVHITGPTASLGFGLAVNRQVGAQIKIHFSFSWHFDVDVTFTLTLADISDGLANLWPAVVTWLEDNLEDVFSELANDVDKWVDAVRNGWLDFEGDVDAITDALFTFFGQTEPRQLAQWLVALDAEFEAAAEAIAKYTGIPVEVAAELLAEAEDGPCSIRTAFDLLAGSNARPSVRPRTLGDRVLFDLKQTDRGRALLTDYLLYEHEIEQLLRNDLTIRSVLRGMDPDEADARPIAAAIAVLDLLAIRGGPRLRAAAIAARSTLAPSINLTYEQFLAALRTR